MKAGRELDALVAERVMGRTNVKFDNDGTRYKRELISDDPKNLYQWVTVPYYSTDISAAMQVVERIGHFFRVSYVPNNVRENWFAEFIRESDHYILEDAPTAPLAICLAALKTVGVEVE